MLGYVLGGTIACVFLLPVLLAERWRRKYSRKYCFPVPRGMGWLQITALWLLGHLPKSVRSSGLLKGYAEFAADKLYPGIKKEIFCRRHQVRKIMLLYGGLLAALLILLFVSVVSRPQELTNGYIQREDARGSGRNITVAAEVQDFAGKQRIMLTVNPRKYTEEEREILIDDVKSYIDKVLPGDNISLRQVDSNLCFPETFPGENVTIEWQPEDYNMIHQDGTLGDISLYTLPIETSVAAVIHYGSHDVQYEKDICIIGQKKTEEEDWQEKLMAALEKADEDSSENMQMQLPAEVDGHSVKWEYPRDSVLPGLFVLALCLIAGLAVCQEEKLKRQVQDREVQLLYDYPGFVHRMVLMLGAGMTVRRSWEELLKDYEREGGKNHSETWLYREMRYARIQMQSGVPEVQVYMNFGRRTELPQYMKFSQLLQQYIRRGSKGMQGMMRQEAYESEKQRRDVARRLGETAGTRLLLPMMLLLIIVLAVVMMPAFLSM